MVGGLSGRMLKYVALPSLLFPSKTLFVAVYCPISGQQIPVTLSSDFFVAVAKLTDY
jgi:hypothetical protein